jgi:dTDP-glucose 4,6-dehydratase
MSTDLSCLRPTCTIEAAEPTASRCSRTKTLKYPAFQFREDHMGRKYLVTGGAGFIASNFIRRVFAEEPEATVTNLDTMTYAGVPATVDELNEFPAHRFVKGDIRDGNLVDRIVPGHDVVVHFAAESHVDRSIDGPAVFLETNVVGTGVLLEAARRHGVGRFIHVSTDEVYGSVR